ncbi:disintegrin and metalloproteinase domain-containing protein 19-like [Sorex fumeus]|uniref:disintegrin and metalloproteinase domain-containing protein 19-like n=1 Tax=Sorex fumeus TaxID=62283 RepID=UPI0024AD16A8|nr:disintegrin and metalloproteinase domain-containing protein 19-like [Sorex fumeus]
MPGAAVGAARLCLLALALPGWMARGSEEGGTLHRRHELVIPQWTPVEPEGLVREKHPRRAELRVKAEGQELVLDLEKNE